MRKILYQQYFDYDCGILTFAGPSSKDGTYAIEVDCGECGEHVTAVLSVDQVQELANEIILAVAKAKNMELT